MSSIQDHGVRAVRRGMVSEDNSINDPQSLVERSYDDEMVGFYLKFVASYYRNDVVQFCSRRKDRKV